MAIEAISARASADGATPGIPPGVLLVCAVGVLALPSAVLAFTTSFATIAADASDQHDPGGLGGDVPGLRLARALPLQSLAHGLLYPYPFTPASNPNHPDRSVTVAVRIDPQAMRAITVTGPGTGAEAKLRLAPTGFSLGAARGYRTFAPAMAPTRRADPPDLAHYAASGSAPAENPRFSSRVVVDDHPVAGRSPRGFAGDREDQVDVGGSYRLTRNLAITAGVRYSQDHERLLPLTDGKQDGQAVYVGTQIHF